MTTKEDADLDDLLEDENHSTNDDEAQPLQSSLEMTQLNLDHLVKGQVDVKTSKQHASPRHHSHEPDSLLPSCCALIQASCSYLAYAHPRACCVCSITGIIITMTLLLSSIMNPTLHYGSMGENDFSSVSSRFDLKQSKIDHWCLNGGDDSCRCEDPLVPTARAEFQTWTRAHAANKALLNEKRGKDVKVAFVGESLVEEMAGRWMGQSRGSQLEGMQKLFEQHFSAENGVEGIALGIAGDTSPNVLWRLLHGEMPDWFFPDVWWVSLGMNDLGRMQCSEEVVVMGILRVVEEILEKRPSATIVINSMLPMADLRGGIYPHVRDYKDSFRDADKATHFVKKPPPPPKKDEKAGNDKTGRRLKRNKNDQDREEGEDANNPEKLDKKTLKRYNRKDPVNPVLNPNETKMKKYQLFKKNRLPLWTSIYAINKALESFCKKNERVVYFDATSIFAERVERGRYMLKSDMISIRGHPTVAGFTKWEDKMVKKVKEILEEEREKAKENVKFMKDTDDNDDGFDNFGFGTNGGGDASSVSSSNEEGVKESSSSESSKDGRR